MSGRFASRRETWAARFATDDCIFDAAPNRLLAAPAVRAINGRRTAGAGRPRGAARVRRCAS